tara:strand:+ start:1323 stop:2357 length:1035 start_codon:yes stop_codon:yes gene_type:complete
MGHDSTDSLAALPPMARSWVRAALDPSRVPRERRADCSACPMVDEAEKSFLSDVRCCTYEPVLANFQVGAYFREGSSWLEAGRRRLSARIAARAGVTPLGIDRPPAYPLWLAADESRFGRDASLRCGYLDASDESHRCTVHEARNAVCATWFCKHERGAVGGRFWLAMRAFLAAAETALAHHCLTELAVSPEALLALTLEQDQPYQEPPAALYAALWGEHRFREQHFYAACHELVSAMPAERVLELGGPVVDRHRRALLAAATRLEDPSVPEQVVLGPRLDRTERGDHVALRPYRDSDPLVLERSTLVDVAACDGRSGIDAERTLGARRLRVLLDHEVLVPGAD